MQARGLSGQDVANALAAQNLITPVGTQKIGSLEYTIQLNNAPSAIAELGDLPIKTVNGATVYLRDVAHVRDGNPPQTNIVHVDGSRSVLMSGAEERRGLDARHHRRHQGQACEQLKADRCRTISRSTLIGDQSLFVERRDQRRRARRRHRGGADQPDDPALPRQLALHRHHRDLDPALDPRLARDPVGARARRSTS